MDTPLSVKEVQLRKDYMATFGTRAGLNVMEDLKNICFYKTPTLFTLHPVTNEIKRMNSSEEIFANEGKRMVLLHILGMIDQEVLKDWKGAEK